MLHDNFKLKNISKNEIHIWQADLQVSPQKIAEFKSILAQDELERSDRFKFDTHRQRFIVARGILRQLIAGYLDIDSKEIVFNYSDRGKPEIKNKSLFFNLSHTQERAVYIFSSDYLVGIDGEYLKENTEYIKLAERFFAPREFQLIKSLPPEQQAHTFFRLWTAKEAYLKATGEGLIGGLDAIEIAIGTENKVKLQAIAGNENKVKDWYLSGFITEDNFIATFAVENFQQTLTIKQFDLN